MMKTVGIIGYGNMGSVIAESIKAKYKVFVFLVGYGDAGLGKGESLPFVINGGSEN